MSFTESQQQAIDCRGTLLVMAGAGTGKTRTLVERCAGGICRADDPISVSQLFVVTFTKAAAAEVRRRLSERLEKAVTTDPSNHHLQEQIELLDTAHISTLHSFCFRLIREHFYDLGLDPQSALMEETDARLMMDEVLEGFLERQYSSITAESLETQALIRNFFGGDDEPLCDLVREIHHYSQTLPDPALWFKAQEERMAHSEPTAWKRQSEIAIRLWASEQLEAHSSLTSENPLKEVLCRGFEEILAHPHRLSDVLAVIRKFDDEKAHWPKGTKGRHREPIKKSLSSYVELSSMIDPANMAQDWLFTQPPLLSILRIVREFGRQYTEQKEQESLLDFHDLEQLSLRLLWSSTSALPTPLAAEWRSRFREIYVDEYQDINEAQDLIIRSLCQPGFEGNRFLVGDVKQSIYRFRQAQPELFLGYSKAWGSSRSSEGRTVHLSENFRSHPQVLNFINHLFRQLMVRQIAEMEYDQNQELRFGAEKHREAFSRSAENAPLVEIHWLRKLSADAEAETQAAPSEETAEEGSEGAAALENLMATEREALLVAQLLQSMHSGKRSIWDESKSQWRPVEWGDVVILLRSPKKQIQGFAKIFQALNIPLQTPSVLIEDSIEVLDLLNVLALLDNPLQDIPLVAILRSPFVGLGLDELAEIRMGQPRGFFHEALRQFLASDRSEPLRKKLSQFFDRLARWRNDSRHDSVSGRLESILRETHYLSWLGQQDRGQHRQQTVAHLLEIARNFDRTARGGLYGFLRFLEQREGASKAVDLPNPSGETGVRIMSIHASKGLEFPVVVLAGVCSKFNDRDSRAKVILDSALGLTSVVMPPDAAVEYQSFGYWMARNREISANMAEELRIMYVALTRAQSRLLVVGSPSEKQLEKWSEKNETPFPLHAIKSARSLADWIGPLASSSQATRGGWKCIVHETTAAVVELKAASTQATWDEVVSQETSEKLKTRFGWKYPFDVSTKQAAKTTVTGLRKQANISMDDDAPARPINLARAVGADSGADALLFGNAHHRCLQSLNLGRAGDPASIKMEILRMVSEGSLTPQEASLIDVEGLRALFATELGRQLVTHAEQVHREMPFTCRLEQSGLPPSLKNIIEVPQGDFVVLQGIADLVWIRENDFMLLDLKTDDIGTSQAAERALQYQPQLELYEGAIQGMLGKECRGKLFFFLRPRMLLVV